MQRQESKKSQIEAGKKYKLPASTSLLNGLPKEIADFIWLFLEPREIMYAASTSQFFSEKSNDERLWKQIITKIFNADAIKNQRENENAKQLFIRLFEENNFKAKCYMTICYSQVGTDLGILMYQNFFQHSFLISSFEADFFEKIDDAQANIISTQRYYIIGFNQPIDFVKTNFANDAKNLAPYVVDLWKRIDNRITGPIKIKFENDEFATREIASEMQLKYSMR